MKEFAIKVAEWLGRWARPDARDPARLRLSRGSGQARPAAEFFVEREPRDVARAFAWHGIHGHEWEEFEE